MATEQIYCVAVAGWPCLTQAEWAAWTQAILSGAAIIIAVQLPARQERRETMRKLDNYMMLLTETASSAEDFAAQVQRRVGAQVDPQWTTQRWVNLGIVFDGIAFHDLPVIDLFGPLHEAANAVKSLHQHAQWLEERARVGQAVSLQVANEIAACARILDKAWLDAADAVNRDRGQSFVQRTIIRIKRFQLLRRMRNQRAHDLRPH